MNVLWVLTIAGTIVTIQQEAITVDADQDTDYAMVIVAMTLMSVTVTMVGVNSAALIQEDHITVNATKLVMLLMMTGMGAPVSTNILVITFL